LQGLKIERLELEEISLAFPLIQLQHKDVTIAQWTEFAQRIIDTRGGSQRGILAARNDQRVIYGILQYEVRCNIQGLCRMGAANVVACGFFREHSVQLIAAMIKTLERMALELGCQRVLIVYSESSDSATIGRLASILEDSGYELTNTTFSKALSRDQK
jgi:hypothetical protein